MKEKIKTLKFIHLALCLGVIFTYVFVNDIDSFSQVLNPTLDSDSAVYIVIPILAVLIGNFLFKKQLAAIDSKLSMEEKLPLYQSASMVRWALLEGAAFIILFTEPKLMVLGILVLAYLISLMPTETRIEKDLGTHKI